MPKFVLKNKDNDKLVWPPLPKWRRKPEYL